MELKEFQGLALRTESQIDSIKIDRANFANILRIVVAVTELLDGIKKGVFYNKNAKLDDNAKVYLRDIIRASKALNTQFEHNDKPSTALFANQLPLDNVDPRMFHGLLGIITESGELGAALLKAIDDPAHSIDAVNVQEEMSDIAWYEAIIHDSTGLDWGQGLANVIEKLRIRYPDKYSDYNADNRNLEAERAALEVGVNASPTFTGKLQLHPDVAAAITGNATQQELNNAMNAWPLKEILGVAVEDTCACGKNPACECKEN